MRTLRYLSLCVLLCPGAVRAGEPRRPNIIIVLADDLGYGDVLVPAAEGGNGANGAGIVGGERPGTPNIDGLARRGVRFTSGYVSAPYCSPTRAGLLTGRYQQRFGHEFNPALVRHGGTGQGLPAGERTIAELLRAAGYVTGLIGKWHLGEDEAFWPQRRGFDEFYGFLAGAHSYFEAEDKNYGPLVRAQKDGPLKPATLTSEASRKGQKGEQAYLTRAFAREACSFIERHRERPFFLYLAFNAVHTPMHAPAKTLAEFRLEPDVTRQTYLAMLKELDDAVGQVLSRVEDLGLEQNTLIVFLSDNGGPTTKFAPNGARNGRLRGSKGDTWEGGIRVPFFVAWKGRIPSEQIIDAPVISLDLLPTALAAAGAEAPAEPALDGVNLLPLLEGKAAAPERALFWRFGSQMAIRRGDWCLARPSLGTKEYEKVATKPMLFNLAKDIGQKRNLAAARPELVRELQAEWDRWNAGLSAPRWPATLRGAVFKMP